jgi:hypothetical protein
MILPASDLLQAFSRLLLFFFVPLLLVCGCASPPFASTAPVSQKASPLFFVEGSYWRPEISGSMKYGNSSQAATKLNIREDLGFDRSEELLCFKGGIRFARLWSLDVEVMNLSQGGNKRLTRNVVWGNKVFPVDYDLDTDLDITSAHLKVGRTLLEGERFSLEMNGGILGIEGEAALLGTAPSPLPMVEEKEDWRVFVPSFGVALFTDLGKGVSLLTETDAAWIRYSDNKAAYLSGSVLIQWAILQQVTLFSGYRFSNLRGEAEDGDIQISYRLSGPVAGVTVRF